MFVFFRGKFYMFVVFELKVFGIGIWYFVLFVDVLKFNIVCS